MMTIFLVKPINNIYDYVVCIIQSVCIEERFPKEYIYIYYIILKLAVLIFQIIPCKLEDINVDHNLTHCIAVRLIWKHLLPWVEVQTTHHLDFQSSMSQKESPPPQGSCYVQIDHNARLRAAVFLFPVGYG